MKKIISIILIVLGAILIFVALNKHDTFNDELNMADYVKIDDSEPIYYLKDGWHIVQSTSKENDTEWAYYEDNKEIKRLSSLIFAHRGWGDAPENSLAAIKMTREQGYYGVEIDVRFTKDKVPVLCHDGKIDRLAIDKATGEKAVNVNVKDKTYDELVNGYIFNITRDGRILEEYNDNKITRFEDALKYIKENQMTVEIELKKGDNIGEEEIASLVKMVQEYDMDNVVKWISFYKELLQYVNKYDDDEIIRFLASSRESYTDEELEVIFHELKTDNNYVKVPYLPGDIVMHWGTPNMPESMEANAASKYILEPIPQGKLTVNKHRVILNNNNVTLNYTYDGDGVVKCESSDNEYVKCTVNKEEKKLVITPIKKIDKIVTISLIASQGVNYSISNEERINCEFDLIKSKEDNTIIVDNKINTKIPYNYVLTINEINKKLEITGENIIIKNANGNTVTNNNEVLGTGSKIILGNNEYVIIVNGDINKDGKISSLDYIAVRNHLMQNKIINSSDVAYKAADINNDNKVSALDYVRIRTIMMEG